MKITLMVAIAATVGMSARAEQTVTVYIEDAAVAPFLVMNRARLIATEIFADVGVRIEWHGHTPRSGQLPSGAVVISLVSQTPAGLLPGALAFAHPYEGTHVTVFWDRIQRPRLASPAVVLAHVLVHEIAHILKGIHRHSNSGIMKACWTPQDYGEMASRLMRFTPDDIPYGPKTGSE